MKNKEKLEELLDDVLELEALLHLAIKRDDCSKELLRLIEKKKRAILEKESAGPAITTQIPDNQDISKEVEDTNENNNSNLSVSEKEVYEIPEEPYEYFIDSENPGNEEEIDIAGETINQEEIQESDAEEAADEKNKEDIDKNLKGRLVFSINDRYRFKKELFNNSDADFNTTLAFVASMENYEEAEEYFFGELGFDSKNPNVGAFMAIIEKYFK